MELELGLETAAAETVSAGTGRFVEVAIDAAGAGGMRTYTYAVPDELADVEAGEAVIVEFGRRQALAVVLRDATELQGIEAKPLAARVRADGPLLPPLSLALARWIAGHYLVAPALVLRAMLRHACSNGSSSSSSGRRQAPPTAAPWLDVVTHDLLDQLAAGPRPARDLAAPEGRAGLLRRLRALEADGLVTVDWTLTAAGAGPRFERWILPTDTGRAAAADPQPSTDVRSARASGTPWPSCQRPRRADCPARRCPGATAAGRSPAWSGEALPRPRSASGHGGPLPRDQPGGAALGPWTRR